MLKRNHGAKTVILTLPFNGLLHHSSFSIRGAARNSQMGTRGVGDGRRSSAMSRAQPQWLRWGHMLKGKEKGEEGVVGRRRGMGRVGDGKGRGWEREGRERKGRLSQHNLTDNPKIPLKIPWLSGYICDRK